MIHIFNFDSGRKFDWCLEAGSYKVGRSPECDIVIDDHTVSRRHANFEIRSDGTITLTDLDSHNGTFVDGQRIAEITSVIPNSTVRFGRLEFRVESQNSSQRVERHLTLSESDSELKNATMLSMESAIKSLPEGITANPQVFNVFSEMGEMLVMPGLDQETYDKSLKLLREIVPAQRLAIYFLGKNNDEVYLVSSHFDKLIGVANITMSRSILREILQLKNAILISDTQSDERFSRQESIVRAGTKSAIAVPLMHNDKIIGILYIDTTNPRHQYNEDILRIVATFGNILASKIANYELIKESQVKAAMEAELTIASQIQHELLPKQMPVLERYCVEAFQSQCQRIGGDLYDTARLKDGKILFMLADVTGKGTGAALLASNILASFRILYDIENFSLLKATSMVSKQLLQFSRPGDFATLFAGVLDISANTLHFINAGHNSPIIVRKDCRVESLDSSGIPIGALDIYSWKEELVEFGVGDLLFAFTDGIPEAIDGSGEQYGDNRLREIIVNNRNQPLAEISRLVQADLNNFTDNLPQADDITMVIVRREL